MGIFCITCPKCGEVDAEPAKINLRQCLDTGEYSFYFICPKCGLRIPGAVSPKFAKELLAAASPLTQWSWPDEFQDIRREAKPGIDVMLDCINALQDKTDPWVAELEGAA